MRVLIVEDLQALRQSLVRTCEQAGYAVDASGDGEEGLWYATSNPYDCVVLDLGLPGIDGLTLLRRMRDGGHQHPVLILSARDGMEDRVAGLDHGADDYLVKPFAPEELLARVRALTRRGHGQRSNHIDAGSLHIDSATRQLAVDGAPVPLTPREFDLLEYLARKDGAVVSRDELWEHLFDFNAEVTSNVIDQWIARIRKKTKATGGHDPIETRRGMGYRFRSQP